MSDLKPCPFCGGTKIKMYSPYSPDLHGFTHLCEINGEAMVKVESRFFKTEEEAEEAWNRRAVNVPDTNVGDTISRQAARNAMRELYREDLERYGIAIPETFDASRAIEAINELPAAQTERNKLKKSYAAGFHDGYMQAQPHWIPVTERLPKQEQEVICQCRASIIKVLKLDADGDWYQDAGHCYMGGFVIAWMSLPEPYKEG